MSDNKLKFDGTKNNCLKIIFAKSWRHFCDLIQEEEGKEESFESEIKKWDWGGGVSTE